MNDIDEAMDAIPNLTERQIELLIEYQISELAQYGGKRTRVAKKEQSEEDLMAALEEIVKTTQPTTTVLKGFKRRA